MCGQLQMIDWEENRQYAHIGVGKTAKTNSTSQKCMWFKYKKGLFLAYLTVQSGGSWLADSYPTW